CWLLLVWAGLLEEWIGINGRCGTRVDGQVAVRAHPWLPIQDERLLVVGMPLEVVVVRRAERVTRVADVADDVARLHRTERPVRRQVRVVDVAFCSPNDHCVAPEAVCRVLGCPVEGRRDGGPL